MKISSANSRQSGLLRHYFNKWLFRLRGAEAGEIYLSQRRVFIMPTKAGAAFVPMLAVLFSASVNYNLSLGLGFTFLITACAVVDMHLTFRNLAYLHLAPGRASTVFAGEDAQFEMHLINRRKYGRYAIWLGFIQSKEPTNLTQSTDVAAHSTSTVILSTPTKERGWLAAPRIRLQTRFPLGLLGAWCYWQPDMKALVYPTPEQNAPPLPVAGESNEEQDKDARGSAGQDDFAGIRPYQAGDSLKRLAWRQIAKMDAESGSALVTKHFEGGAANQLSIDFEKLPATIDIELKLSRMTRWILEAEAAGIPYAFRLGNITYAAALGPAHQHACLHALALYGMKG